MSATATATKPADVALVRLVDVREIKDRLANAKRALGAVETELEAVHAERSALVADAAVGRRDIARISPNNAPAALDERIRGLESLRSIRVEAIALIEGELAPYDSPERKAAAARSRARIAELWPELIEAGAGIGQAFADLQAAFRREEAIREELRQLQPHGAIGPASDRAGGMFHHMKVYLSPYADEWAARSAASAIIPPGAAAWREYWRENHREPALDGLV